MANKQKTVSSKHITGSSFEAHIDGHSIRFDDSDGNTGPRPKAILLSALAICVGFDLVPILNKMRVSFSGLNLVTTADVSETIPSVYTKIELVIELKTDLINRSKVERAVKLSVEDYCGVYAMLIKVCPIEYRIRYLRE
ncbi:MAG: OsmC family protein [Flavobacteriales bacterium]|nr:OsmC family protein [Flavobacteriales bacterium]